MTATRSAVLRESALWGTAAVVVLTAHLGSALWLLRQAEAAAPPGLPEPVFVELAPEPMADAPEDLQEAEELPEVAPEPEPEIALPPLPELELPDMDTLFPPPPEAVVLNKSERPQERPEPEEEKIVEKPREKLPEPEKKKPKAPEELPATRKTTQVRAPQADRSAAPQGQVGQPSRQQVASWQSRVQAAVARHMQRTRFSGRGGSMTVTVRFSVDPSGRVAGAQLVSSTGDAKIDSALNRQAGRMPRLPAPPSGKTTSLVLPVLVVLR